MPIPSGYPVSTVPAVIVYLTQVFQAELSTDPNPQNITLFVGNDPGLADTPDLVAIVDVQRNLEHFAMVGSGMDLAMYEKYSVMIRISSAQRGATEAEAAAALTQRVWELLAYCEYAVRQDPSLGGIVLTAWPGQAQGGMVQLAPDNNGWIAELATRVDIEADQ